MADPVRRLLIDACRDLCIEVGLDAATTKAIAERAGVNPAMINYYFDSKEGLGIAMMHELIAPVRAQLDTAAAQLADGDVTLDVFVAGYMRVLSANPWLPPIVVREVLPANGRFREFFVTEIASRASGLLPTLIQRGKAAGRIDPGIDSGLVIMTLISLAIFPFVSAPVLGPVLGVDPFDDATVERMIEHTTALLSRALQPGTSG